MSQVLSDFVGEIKANIGTEIQMGTRYEGDLERVSMKYGEDVLKSVVKEPVGTGMVVNAEYNDGIPYFVSYRPILHGVKRLTKKELVDYEKYFTEIEDLEYQIEQLAEMEEDVLDLKLEIKLSKSKVKAGKFQMADMYLETLRPKFVAHWKKLGKSPMHIVREKLNKAVVAKGIAEAKKERAKYIKKNPGKSISFKEAVVKLKGRVDLKKKEGIDTSAVEIKLKALEDRLRPFKGNVDSRDARSIKVEFNAVAKELRALKKSKETKK